MDHHPQEVWTADPALLGEPELVVMARSMIAARRALAGPLPIELLRDPALDILLALFVVHGTARQVAQSELLGRLTISPSTGMRWIAALKQYGLVIASGEIVQLSTAGVQKVTASLHAVADSQWHLADVC